MPFSGAGVFSRNRDWTDDRDNNILILADAHDTHDQDIADALTAIIAGSVPFVGPVNFPDGTSSLPSITFTSDTNTGFYWKTSGRIAFSSNGVGNTWLDGQGVGLPNGTVSAPGLFYTADSTTGFFRETDGSVSTAVNGVVTAKAVYDAAAPYMSFPEDIVVNGVTVSPGSGSVDDVIGFSSTTTSLVPMKVSIWRDKVYKNSTTTTPPASPAEGDKYVVGTGATGEWAGKDGQLAGWSNSKWNFLAPATGVIYYDQGTSAWMQYDGTSWVALGDTFALRTITREKLTAARTYYVDGTNGSDSNDGMSSGSGAFATIQKAVDTAQSIDNSIYQISISVAAGSYNEQVTIKGGLLGSGDCVITGDTTTPSNVKVGSGQTNSFLVKNGAFVTIQGFQFDATASGVRAQTKSVVTCKDCKSNVGTRMFYIESGANVIASSTNLEILANNTNIASMYGQSYLTLFGTTITLTASHAWGAAGAFYMRQQTYCWLKNTVFSLTGTGTGLRYNVGSGSMLDTEGGAADFIPGDSATLFSSDGAYYL